MSSILGFCLPSILTVSVNIVPPILLISLWRFCAREMLGDCKGGEFWVQRDAQNLLGRIPKPKFLKWSSSGFWDNNYATFIYCHIRQGKSYSSSSDEHNRRIQS